MTKCVKNIFLSMFLLLIGLFFVSCPEPSGESQWELTKPVYIGISNGVVQESGYIPESGDYLWASFNGGMGDGVLDECYIQWFYCNSTGELVNEIPGANKIDYRLTNNDVGRWIRVKCTGKGRYYGFVISDPVGPVRSCINGSVKIDINYDNKTATAFYEGDYQGESGELEYYWFYGRYNDGFDEGSIISSFGPCSNVVDIPEAAIEHHLWVKCKPQNSERFVYGREYVYNYFSDHAISIVGNAVVGGTLAIDINDWGKEPREVFEWYADGQKIEGATDRFYTLTNAEFGKSISARWYYSEYEHYFEAKHPDVVQAVLSGTVRIIGDYFRVGDTLTASYEGNAGDSVYFEWYTMQDLSTGVIGDSYTLRESDINGQLYVKVYGQGLYTGSLASAYTSTIVAKDVVQESINGSVTISGNLKVGEVLTANYSGNAGNSVNYEWFRNGNKIENENGRTYTLTMDDSQCNIKVSVTGRDNYSGSIESLETDKIIGPELITGVVVIDGKPFIGETLTATYSGNAGESISYQWCVDVNGEEYEIPRETRSTLKVANDNYYGGTTGKSIYVKIKGINDYYGEICSSKTDSVKYLFTGSAEIRGTARVGNSLYINCNSSGGSYSCQWYADDVAIEKAVYSSYEPKADDVGKRIHVVITSSYEDYVGEIVSEKTEIVVSAIDDSRIYISGSGEINNRSDEGKLTIKESYSGAMANNSNTIKCQWYADDVAIEGATELTYKLKLEDLGKIISAVIQSDKGKIELRNDDKIIYDLLHDSKDLISVTGNLEVGNKITATYTGPVADSVKIEWRDSDNSNYKIMGKDASFTPELKEGGHTYYIYVYSDNENIKYYLNKDVYIARPPITGTVKITGNAVEGETLTAEYEGDLNPEELRYQWEYKLSDGYSTMVSGYGSRSYYSLNEHNVNKEVYVEVYHDLYSGCLKSEPTTAVLPAIKKTLTISGNALEGETLTAIYHTDEEVKLTYQWYANDVAIEGATNQTYKLTQAEGEKRISVKAFGVETTGGSVSCSMNDRVKYLLNGTLTISGNMIAGETVTATYTGNGNAESEYIYYDWYTEDGERFTWGSEVTLPGSVLGKKVYVEVCCDSNSIYGGTITSDLTDRVMLNVDTGLSYTYGESFRTTLRAGDTVKAYHYSYNAELFCTYQWYADDVAIDGATEWEYTITENERGKVLYAKISVPACDITNVQTESTTKVQTPITGSVTITGTPAVGNTVTAVYEGNAGNSVQYLFVDGSSPYYWNTFGDPNTYTFYDSQKGSTYYVRVKGTGDYYGEIISEEGVKVLGVLSSVSIAGFNTYYGNGHNKEGAVGTTLKASVDGYADYQWYADGVEITGETENTYVITEDVAGKNITVKATGDGSYIGTVESNSIKAYIPIEGEIRFSGYRNRDSFGVYHFNDGDIITAVFIGNASDEDITYEWYYYRASSSDKNIKITTTTNNKLTLDINADWMTPHESDDGYGAVLYVKVTGKGKYEGATSYLEQNCGIGVQAYVSPDVSIILPEYNEQSPDVLNITYLGREYFTYEDSKKSYIYKFKIEYDKDSTQTEIYFVDGNGDVSDTYYYRDQPGYFIDESQLKPGMNQLIIKYKNNESTNNYWTMSIVKFYVKPVQE